jgi:hypothetical protein
MRRRGNDTLPAAARAGLAVGLDRSLAMLAAAPLGSPNWRSRRLRAALLCQPQYRTEKTGAAALIGRSQQRMAGVDLVDLAHPSSNPLGDSNTLWSWLREVAELRQAA